jgi:hypothetical protein
MGAMSIAWTVAVLELSPTNLLGDSIAALGFSIAFYYGFTGIACTIYFRRELFESVKKFLLVGVVPLVGGLVMAAVFAKSASDLSKSDAGSSSPVFGIQVPVFIGIGGLILGIVVMLFTWPFYREFFRRRPEAAPPGLLDVPVEHAAAHL